jgi:hypothetical protein
MEGRKRDFIAGGDWKCGLSNSCDVQVRLELASRLRTREDQAVSA